MPLHKLATYLSCDPCSERGWTLSILNLPGTPHHWIKLTFLPLKPAGLEDCCLSPGLYSCLFLHFLHLFSWTCRSCSVLLTAVLCDMWKLFKNPKCFVQCILGRWCLAKRNNTNLQNLLHETNVFKSSSHQRFSPGLPHKQQRFCPTFAHLLIWSSSFSSAFGLISLLCFPLLAQQKTPCSSTAG